jgi:hypothetical protein
MQKKGLKFGQFYHLHHLQDVVVRVVGSAMPLPEKCGGVYSNLPTTAGHDPSL